MWWVGNIAFVYVVYLSIKRKDNMALFLVIAYLAQLVSWIPVTRTTYIYHYFPSVPFVVLMIGYSIYTLYHTYTKKTIKTSAFVYTAIAIGLFILFYPVLSGQPCNTEFAEKYLKWFNSWVLL